MDLLVVKSGSVIVVLIRFIGTNANIDLLAVKSGTGVVALGPSPVTFIATTETYS